MNRVDKMRRDCNRQIIDMLTLYLDAFPTIRFGQALVNLDIVPRPSTVFYEEPDATLKRVEAAIAEVLQPPKEGE